MYSSSILRQLLGWLSYWLLTHVAMMTTFDHTPQNQNPTLTHRNPTQMAVVSMSALMIQRHTMKKKMGNLISSANIIVPFSMYS